MGIKVLLAPPTLTMDAVDIADASAIKVSVGASAAVIVSSLESTFYDAWATQDMYVKVAGDPSTVTSANGYLVRANNTITLAMRSGMNLGVLCTSAGGLLTLHRVWNPNA